MSSALRNVTLTLEEDLARWARVQAAERDVSVSRYLADLLRAQMQRQGVYETAQARALARRPVVLAKDKRKPPGRDELYDRPVLRRH